MALVGRIARPHGLRGDVVIAPATDFVEQRFRVGATLWTRSPRGDELLTVEAFRLQNGRPIVTFAGFARIEDVERLAGLELRIDAGELQPLEPGRYYEHDLVGCEVATAGQGVIGTVVRVEGGAGNARLVVAGAGGEMLIPLAVAICTSIDVAAKRIQVEPPEGLLEVNEVRHRHDLPSNDRGGTRGRRRRPRT